NIGNDKMTNTKRIIEFLLENKYAKDLFDEDNDKLPVYYFPIESLLPDNIEEIDIDKDHINMFFKHGLISEKLLEYYTYEHLFTIFDKDTLLIKLSNLLYKKYNSYFPIRILKK